MAHRITLIPGDGIGPEVTQAVVRILEATGLKFEWESFAAGAEAFEKYKEYIPKELTESIERTRVGLKGPVTTPIGGGFSSINVELRKKFELFAEGGGNTWGLDFDRHGNAAGQRLEKSARSSRASRSSRPS